MLYRKNAPNKKLNKDKKQLAFAPSSLILTNYFSPVNRALTSQRSHNINNLSEYKSVTDLKVPFSLYSECLSLLFKAIGQYHKTPSLAACLLNVSLFKNVQQGLN